jgi:hypothetical protein
LKKGRAEEEKRFKQIENDNQFDEYDDDEEQQKPTTINWNSFVDQKTVLMFLLLK